MDNEQEKMQFLGFFGVYKESYKIIFSWRKIFTKITLALILPLSLIFLFCMEVLYVLSGNTSHDSDEKTKTHFGTPQHQNLNDNNMSSEQATLSLFKPFYYTFILILSLLSTSAVVYTVASFYTGRQVTFKNVLSVVPKVWTRLFVTFLCTMVVFLFSNFIAALVFMILTLSIGAPNGGTVIIWVMVMLLFFAGLLYLTVVWQLANVVTVLEESYAFEAMAKSMELVKGKMVLSMIITLKHKVSFFLILFLFLIVVVDRWKLFRLGTLSRTAWAILCFLVLSHLFLLVLVLQTVLYFVCKSYHNQNIDKSALSNHLDVYQEEYEPPKSKEAQLDNKV